MQQHDPLFITVEDVILHTQESLFCVVDPTCRCHEDPELLADVADAVNEGLLTPYEASLVISSKTI